VTYQEKSLLNSLAAQVEQLTARVEELEKQIAELTKGQQ